MATRQITLKQDIRSVVVPAPGLSYMRGTYGSFRQPTVTIQPLVNPVRAYPQSDEDVGSIPTRSSPHIVVEPGESVSLGTRWVRSLLDTGIVFLSSHETPTALACVIDNPTPHPTALEAIASSVADANRQRSALDVTGETLFPCIIFPTTNYPDIDEPPTFAQVVSRVLSPNQVVMPKHSGVYSGVHDFLRNGTDSSGLFLLDTSHPIQTLSLIHI